MNSSRLDPNSMILSLTQILLDKPLREYNRRDLALATAKVKTLILKTMTSPMTNQMTNQALLSKIMSNRQIEHTVSSVSKVFRLGWYCQHPDDKILKDVKNVYTECVFNALRANSTTTGA